LLFWWVRSHCSKESIRKVRRTGSWSYAIRTRERIAGIHAGLDRALIDQAGVKYSPHDVEQGFQQQGLLAGEIKMCGSTGHTRRFRRVLDGGRRLATLHGLGCRVHERGTRAPALIQSWFFVLDISTTS
jgi:hypothetical protein